VLDPAYCRAKARACEERANETSDDFIMKEFWFWLAREWHELANRVEVNGPYAERSPDEGEADPGAKSRGS
jgi:hypothetical protein